MDVVKMREAGDLSGLTRKQKKDSEIQKGSYKKSTAHEKLNKSSGCRTHPLMSPSINDKGLCNYVAMIQNVIRMENDVTPCRADYYEFPYYRFDFAYVVTFN